MRLLPAYVQFTPVKTSYHKHWTLLKRKWILQWYGMRKAPSSLELWIIFFSKWCFLSTSYLANRSTSIVELTFNNLEKKVEWAGPAASEPDLNPCCLIRSSLSYYVAYTGERIWSFSLSWNKLSSLSPSCDFCVELSLVQSRQSIEMGWSLTSKQVTEC